MKENPYLFGNFSVLQKNAPFLILAIDKILADETGNLDFVFDIKILIDGKVSWMTLDPEIVEVLARTWIKPK